MVSQLEPISCRDWLRVASSDDVAMGVNHQICIGFEAIGGDIRAALAAVGARISGGSDNGRCCFRLAFYDNSRGTTRTSAHHGPFPPDQDA